MSGTPPGTGKLPVPVPLAKALDEVFGIENVTAAMAGLGERRGRQRDDPKDTDRLFKALALEAMQDATPYAAMMTVLRREGIAKLNERRAVFRRIDLRRKALIAQFRKTGRVNSRAVRLWGPDADETARWVRLLRGEGP